MGSCTDTVVISHINETRVILSCRRVLIKFMQAQLLKIEVFFSFITNFISLDFYHAPYSFRRYTTPTMMTTTKDGLPTFLQADTHTQNKKAGHPQQDATQMKYHKVRYSHRTFSTYAYFA